MPTKRVFCSLIRLTLFLSFASFLSCIFRILMLPIPGWSKQTLQKSEKSSARDWESERHASSLNVDHPPPHLQVTSGGVGGGNEGFTSTQFHSQRSRWGAGEAGDEGG